MEGPNSKNLLLKTSLLLSS